VKLKLK